MAEVELAGTVPGKRDVYRWVWPNYADFHTEFGLFGGLNRCQLVIELILAQTNMAIGTLGKRFGTLEIAIGTVENSFGTH